MTPAELVKLGSSLGNITAYDKDVVVPPGFERVEDLTVNNLSNGFQAVGYHNPITKQVLFGIAGTNDYLDRKGWNAVVSGFGGNPEQIAFGTAFMQKVDNYAKETKATVIAAGHSYAGLYTDIGAHAFGWTTVKFDAVGGLNVINSSGFQAELNSLGITPASGGSVISCNINGFGPFGGSAVGGMGGRDLPGTTNCRIDLPSSSTSSVLGVLSTVALGSFGFVAQKLISTVVQHDSTGIDEAVQAGKFTVGSPAPIPQTSFEPYSFTDDDGNILRTVQGANGRPVLDEKGNPKLELVLAPPTTGIGGEIIQFDSSGAVKTSIDTTTNTVSVSQYETDGDLVGSVTTEQLPDSPSPTDGLANQLQSLLNGNEAWNDEVLEAAEIRSIAGAQTSNEAWGGGRLLVASDGYLGDYYWASEHDSAITQTGSGITVATESTAGGAQTAGTGKAFVSQNTNAANDAYRRRAA